MYVSLSVFESCSVSVSGFVSALVSVSGFGFVPVSVSVSVSVSVFVSVSLSVYNWIKKTTSFIANMFLTNHLYIFAVAVCLFEYNKTG